MQVGEFNANFSRAMASVVANGEPEPITRYRKSYARLVPEDLYNELLDAAGEQGQEVLERHRTAGKRPQETAA